MNDKRNENELMNEFREFVRSESSVPKELSEKILNFVRHDLTPSAVFVFTKIVFIHLFVGTLSLAICDQFGINPFNTSFSLAHYFMKAGHSFCMTLCGFLFLGLTTIASWFILSRTEFLVLKQNTFLQVFFLSLLSLGFFLLLGVKIVFSAAAFWLFGALLGGVLIIYIVSDTSSVNSLR